MIQQWSKILNNSLCSSNASTMNRRPDDAEVSQFLDDLAVRLRDGRIRTSLWPETPNYLFHITQLGNAMSILSHRCLLSRDRAIDLDVDMAENASPQIIASTIPDIHRNVRLYFRPRTPTFYRNEGIRSPEQIELNAHMPVPIAFLFDARDVLGRVGTRFSDGSLARRGWIRLFQGSEGLRKLDFNAIYHAEPFEDDDDRSWITSKRQAEVIVRDELLLDGVLKRIGVRSTAEYETLRTLLDEHVSNRTDEVMRSVEIDSRSRWFFKKWTFIDRVIAQPDHLLVYANPSSPPATFSVHAGFRGEHEASTHEQTWRATIDRRPIRLPIPMAFRATNFRLELRFDGHLAYANRFTTEREWSLIAGASPS